MTREELRLKLQEASDKLKEAFDELEPVATEYHDLKLHEISAEADDDDFSNYFGDFCELSFEDFKDFIENRNVRTEYVGRTSSFTFTTNYLKDIDCDEFNYFVETLAMKASRDCSYIDRIHQVDDKLLDDIEEMLSRGELDSNYLQEEIDDILAEIPRVKESIEDIREAVDYIDKFKQNQLKYWIDYVEMRKED